LLREYREVRAGIGAYWDLPHRPFVLSERVVSLRSRFEPPALCTGALGRVPLLAEARTARRGDRLADRINVVRIPKSSGQEKKKFVGFRWAVRDRSLGLSV